MAVDIEQLLRDAVTEALGSEYDVTYAPDGRSHVATIRSRSDGARAVELHASPDWFAIQIPELDVGGIDFDYSENEAEKRELLDEFIAVAGAYLEGQGVVTRRRGLLRERAVLTVRTARHEWRLGRGSHTVRDRFTNDG